jgi:7-cyano-7-deazaguanine synthase
MTEALVVFSGGLDSTTLLYRAVIDLGAENVKAISFDYGQRHKKELQYAQRTTDLLGVSHEVVDITSITSFLTSPEGTGSALVTDSDVPEGHYGEESMKQTVVPNRNMIMASIAAGHAVAIGAKALWMGVHAGDHFIYPDCRPRFFHALNAAIVIGNEGFGGMPELFDNAEIGNFVHTPYIHVTKADIARDALANGVPISMTWSCYQGDAIHCGKCGTCVERIEAIQEAIMSFPEDVRTVNRLHDPTEYRDAEFWKEAVKRSTV